MAKNFRSRLRSGTGSRLRSGLLTLLAVVVFLLVVPLLVFFATPEIQIRTSTLRWAVERFLPETMELTFTSASLRLTRTSFFYKHIQLKSDGLCFSTGDRAIQFYSKEIDLGVELGLKGLKPHLVEFNPAQLRGGRLLLKRSDSQEPAPVQDGDAVSSVFGWLAWLRDEVLTKWNFANTEIDLDIRRPPDLRAQVEVSGHQGPPESLFIKARELQGFGHAIERFRAEVWQESDQPWQVKASFRLRPQEVQKNDSWSAQILAHLSLVGEQAAEYRFTADFKRFRFMRAIELKGLFEKSSLRGLLSFKPGGYRSPIQSARFVGCQYRLKTDLRSAALNCGPQTVDIRIHEVKGLPRKQLFRLHPTFDLELNQISWADGFRADIDFKFHLDYLKALSVRLAADGQVDLRQNGTRHFRLKTENQIELREFASLVRELQRTPYAVPAPLNQMAGPVTFWFSGSSTERGGNFESRLRTDLRSKFQAFKSELLAEFNLLPSQQETPQQIGAPRITASEDEAAPNEGSRSAASSASAARVPARASQQKKSSRLETGIFGLRPSVSLRWQIENLHLSLPRFDVANGIPRFRPDSRFSQDLRERYRREEQIALKPQPSKPPAVDFQIQAETKRSNSVQIASGFTKEPIPVALDLSVKGGRELATAFDLRLSRTPLEIGGITKLLKRLEREAWLQHFRLQVDERGESRLDGRFLVRNPDAELYVIILGSLQNPSLRFESDPPASENQVIAALLFGRPVQEVDPAEQESAAAVRTALNDTALTIVQMYLLAQTPIDSLNYDPDSGRIIASVQLAQGTSLEFGGASGAGREVGIRRRLARNLYLNTYVEDSAQTDATVVNAFVEWVRRF